MELAHTLGLILTGAGLLGYAMGLTQAYPGRSFSVTMVMVGVTLYAVSKSVDRLGANS